MERPKKRIIHVVQRLSPGGIEVLALNMLKHAHRDEQVLIVSLESNKQSAIDHWPALKPYEQQLIFLDKPAKLSLATAIRLVRLFKTLKPSVVHSHHIGPLLYASIAARITGVKCRIHTEHDAWHLNSAKHRWIQRLAFKLASPIVVSDAKIVHHQLKTHLGFCSGLVIKNGIDSTRFKPGSKQDARTTLCLPKNSNLIGSAGRLEKVKGHSLLISALSSLPTGVELVIAGQGSELGALQQQAIDLDVGHRVHFLGQVDDMPTFYQALDLFCLPSMAEGFPLSTLEAQSCDVVTVATDVGAVKETLCPSSSYLVEAADSQLLSTVLKRAMETVTHYSPRSFVVKNNDLQHMLNAYRQLSDNVYRL